MISNTNEVLRLLGQMRRLRKQDPEVEHQLLVALGFRKQYPVYERAVRWLLAALIEKPARRIVDAIFNRLDRWRKDR